ncbi:MAG TPA: SPOR domain-containing protein [Steroidobacteraceae bacterium]|jgi:cell division septation protein DedD|nr:SPOR domain-containing protein [Steroidobacteraceae bacterium]
MVIKQALLVLSLTCALALCGCSRQQSDWEKTRTANTAEAYEQFVKKYPSGEFTAQAKAQLKGLYEERDWQKARDTDTLEAYQAFLKQYPEGKWTEEARIRVENFTLAAAPSNTPPTGSETPPQTAPQTPPPTAAPPNPNPSKPAPAKAVGPSMHMAMKAQGSYGVQLGAFKSGADAANARWARLDKEYASLLSGLTPKVSPKKGASGTLYRLQVAGLSEKRANAICKTLKAHSQGCLLIK